MKELAQVQEAVLKALNQAGLRSFAAFPEGEARDFRGAAASVAVGAAEGRALGFCNYLGEAWDEQAGTVRELYGKQLEGEITVEVRASSAAECERGVQQASEVLLGDLPQGIRPGELRWEALGWEKATGLFLRRGSLQCRALFTAESREDGAVFLDFILRGVMRN